MAHLDRRALLILGLGVATGARAATLRRPVAFQVWRGGAQIGSHEVSLSSRGTRTLAAISAAMRVKIGPIPVFTYHHEATEIWDGDRFESLVSRSVSNGKVETVDARRADTGVVITDGRGRKILASELCAPLTHWNREAFRGPLFNPQTGALIRCSVKPQGAEALRDAEGRAMTATGFAIKGDADIVDWYDEGGAWAALQAKASDGSTIEYRRI